MVALGSLAAAAVESVGQAAPIEAKPCRAVARRTPGVPSSRASADALRSAAGDGECSGTPTCQLRNRRRRRSHASQCRARRPDLLRGHVSRVRHVAAAPGKRRRAPAQARQPVDAAGYVLNCMEARRRGLPVIRKRHPIVRSQPKIRPCLTPRGRTFAFRLRVIGAMFERLLDELWAHRPSPAHVAHSGVRALASGTPAA